MPGECPFVVPIFLFIYREKVTESALIQADPLADGHPSLRVCRTDTSKYMKGTEKDQSIAWIEKKEIWIDNKTGRPPEEGKTDDLELKEHLIGHDSFSDEYCLTCPHEGEKPTTVTLDEFLFITKTSPAPQN